MTVTGQLLPAIGERCSWSPSAARARAGGTGGEPGSEGAGLEGRRDGAMYGRVLGAAGERLPGTSIEAVAPVLTAPRVEGGRPPRPVPLSESAERHVHRHLRPAGIGSVVRQRGRRFGHARCGWTRIRGCRRHGRRLQGGISDLKKGERRRSRVRSCPGAASSAAARSGLTGRGSQGTARVARPLEEIELWPVERAAVVHDGVVGVGIESQSTWSAWKSSVARSRTWALLSRLRAFHEVTCSPWALLPSRPGHRRFTVPDSSMRRRRRVGVSVPVLGCHVAHYRTSGRGCRHAGETGSLCARS